jgi:hypothetical protein
MQNLAKKTFLFILIFLCHAGIHKKLIFAGCYDNDPWYLVTNLAGHLDLAGHLGLVGILFYFIYVCFLQADVLKT